MAVRYYVKGSADGGCKIEQCEQNLQIHAEKRATSTNSFHTLCAAQNLQIHLEEMAIFFSSCKIWIFHGYILAFKLAFLQKFLNQKVQFSTNIKTKQKNPFAKMVRILQIHLISLRRNGQFQKAVAGPSYCHWFKFSLLPSSIHMTIAVK